MKNNLRKEILPLLLIFIIIVIGVVSYPRLKSAPSPEDGLFEKIFNNNPVVLIFPFIVLFLYAVLIFLPLLDPWRENYFKFKSSYFWFRTAFIILLALLYIVSIWAAYDDRIKIGFFTIPLFAVFYIYLGLFAPKIKKNYFVGIRTPWTIASELVWEKTHKFGSKLYIASGVIALAGLLFPDYSLWFLILPMLLSVLASEAYSFLIFKKLGD